MKTYQIYEAPVFPQMNLGDHDVTTSQLAMFGANEEVSTRVTKVRVDIEGFDEFRVQSQIRIATYGVIRYYDAIRRETVTKEFSEYLKPVDFLMYHHPAERFVALQNPRKVCDAVKDNVNRQSQTIRWRDRRVDFATVRQNHAEFAGAWFRQVSANIHAEGLHGENVQNDPRFQELLEIAEMSSLTLRYNYDAAHHKVMITKQSAVVFQQAYPTVEIELALLLSVKQAILDKAWVPLP
jgi:hypothetical protein